MSLGASRFGGMMFACEDVLPVTLRKMRSAEVKVFRLGADLLIVFDDSFNT